MANNQGKPILFYNCWQSYLFHRHVSLGNYVWLRYFADTEIVTDSDFDVSSDGVSLTVRQALPRFQGVYTCHADSVTGSVVKSARLIVNTENGESMPSNDIVETM